MHTPPSIHIHPIAPMHGSGAMRHAVHAAGMRHAEMPTSDVHPAEMPTSEMPTSEMPTAAVAIVMLAAACAVMMALCAFFPVYDTPVQDARRSLDMRGDYEHVAGCEKQRRLARVANMMLNLTRSSQKPRQLHLTPRR